MGGAADLPGWAMTYYWGDAMEDRDLETSVRARLAEDARSLLVERLRVGIWINLLACAGFVIVEFVATGSPEVATSALGGGQVAAGAAAILALRTRRGSEYALHVSLPAIAVVCALGARAAGYRADAVGYDMLLVAMTIGAAAFIPWTTRWQLALVAIATAATAAGDYFSPNARHNAGDPLVIGVGISFLASVYIAGVLQRERAAAQDRELHRQIAAAELAASREQLRALSARLVSVQEDERTRIAREVHDELGQKLTALKFMASALGEQAAADGEIARRSREVIELLDSTLQSVQRISKSLRPSVLDDLGFGAALTSLVNEFEDLTTIECEIDLQESLPVDRDASTALYRILQEALTNVARHASAKHVWVSVRARKRFVELSVADDGKGVAASAKLASTSLGIIGMRERARACGGDLKVEQAEQGGVLLTARVARA